ncbi:unnamed protein product [Boreogadus saida]
MASSAKLKLKQRRPLLAAVCFGVEASLGARLGRLAQQYVYPQAMLQPGLVLQPQQLSSPPAALASHYLDYSSMYSHYAGLAGGGLEPYPYAPSPTAGYLGYSFSPAAAASAPGHAISPPIHTHPPLPPPPQLAPLVGGPPASYLHYPLLQPDRMQ